MKTSGIGVFIRKHKLFFALLAAAGAAMVLMAWFVAKPLWPLPDQYTDLWNGENPEVWDVYVFEDGVRQDLTYSGYMSYTGPLQNAQMFYASRTLDAEYDNALLEIQSGAPVAVFLDEELLYAEAPVIHPKIGEATMTETVSLRTVPLFLPLPGDYAGKTLTIVQPIVSEKEDVTVPEVFLGPASLESQARYDTGIISAAARTIYPGLALTCLGLVFVVLLLSSAYNNRVSLDILFFCGFVFLLAIEFYLFSDSLNYYYANNIPILIIQGAALCCLFLFLSVHLGRFRTPALILTGALAAFLVWQALANALEIYVPWLSELLYDLAFGNAVAMIVFEFLEGRRGNSFAALFSRLFLAGLAVLAVVIFISWQLKTAWFESFALQMEIMASNLYFGYALTIVRYLLICVCSLSLCVWFVRDAMQRRVDTALMEQRAEAVEKNTAQMRDYARQTAMLRHDMHKHLGVVNLYLQSGELGKATDYLHEVGAALDAVPAVVFTGNETVDLILNAQIALAEEDGLHLSFEVHPLPKLPLSETEISSLLVNTLENAFRAARETEARSVEVQAYVRDGFFCYSCRNSCPVSSSQAEKRQSGHGYGLRIIEEIAKKNDGLLRVEQTGDCFVVSVAFPLTQPGS